MKVKNKIINYSVLLLLFIISIIVRLDNLVRPMSKHHEYITAHILCTDYRFYKEGAAKFNFSPVINFDSDAERKCSKFHLLKDRDNNFYYYSYPPFAFLFPHIVFTIIHTEPNVTGIRVISLALHFICAFLCFQIVLFIFRKTTSDPVFIPAIISYAIYLFSSGNLWFHANVYFSDTLVQPMLFGILFLFLKIFNTDLIKTKHYAGVFILGFIGVYTEYLMLFFLFFAAIVFLVSSLCLKRADYFKIVYVIVIASLSGLGLTLFQYTSLSNFAALKTALTDRYALRSGHSETASQGLSLHDSISYDILSEHYEKNYGILLDFLWLVMVLAVIVYFVKQKNASELTVKGLVQLFIILVLAYGIHMIAFFNFNVVHDFGTLKSMLILIPATGICLGYIYELLNFKKIISVLSILGCGLFIHLSLNNYYQINNSSTGEKYIQQLSALVRKYGKQDQLMATNNYFTYETCFYSKRRVESEKNLHEVLYVLSYCDIKEGLFFERKGDYYNVIKIDQKGDTTIIAKEKISDINQ